MSDSTPPSKRIVICSDGTWNRPEEDLETDHPTNVLRLARGIKPFDGPGTPQHVFYDWGIGSYYAKVRGGVSGNGIHKNIMDAYRYIVQNYTPGAEIYLFGFSRGAYTVRSLCGLINNCGILKRPDARLIAQAFDHYKKEGDDYAPDGAASIAFRKQHAHASRRIHFVGAWDTVGALGVPFSVLGFMDRTDEFYDTKLGANVGIARHALAIDERRSDFEPTLWTPRPSLDLQQVWFAGVHGDIGGGYEPDEKHGSASDFPLQWILGEARKAGLKLEPHLTQGLKPGGNTKIHRSRRHIYRFREPYERPLHHDDIPTGIHTSVKARFDADKRYRPPNLKEYLDTHGWPELVK
jgi:uncharacterized protein (DUF2235 family)